MVQVVGFIARNVVLAGLEFFIACLTLSTVSFLVANKRDDQEIALLVATFFASQPVGALVVGLLIDIVGRRKSLIVVGSLLSLGLLGMLTAMLLNTRLVGEHVELTPRFESAAGEAAGPSWRSGPTGPGGGIVAWTDAAVDRPLDMLHQSTTLSRQAAGAESDAAPGRTGGAPPDGRTSRFPPSNSITFLETYSEAPHQGRSLLTSAPFVPIKNLLRSIDELPRKKNLRTLFMASLAVGGAAVGGSYPTSAVFLSESVTAKTRTVAIASLLLLQEIARVATRALAAIIYWATSKQDRPGPTFSPAPAAGFPDTSLRVVVEASGGPPRLVQDSQSSTQSLALVFFLLVATVFSLAVFTTIGIVLAAIEPQIFHWTHGWTKPFTARDFAYNTPTISNSFRPGGSTCSRVVVGNPTRVSSSSSNGMLSTRAAAGNAADSYLPRPPSARAVLSGVSIQDLIQPLLDRHHARLMSGNQDQDGRSDGYDLRVVGPSLRSGSANLQRISTGNRSKGGDCLGDSFSKPWIEGGCATSLDKRGRSTAGAFASTESLLSNSTGTDCRANGDEGAAVGLLRVGLLSTPPQEDPIETESIDAPITPPPARAATFAAPVMSPVSPWARTSWLRTPPHQRPISAASRWRQSLDLHVRAFFVPLLGTGLPWMLFDLVFYGNGIFHFLFVRRVAGYESDRQENLVALAVHIVCLIGYLLVLGLIRRMAPKLLQILGFVVVSFVYFGISLSIYSIHRGAATKPERISSFMGASLLYDCVFQFFLCLPNITTFVLAVDCFPTKFRGTLVGIAACFGRIGANLGVWISYAATKLHETQPIMLLASSGIYVTAAAVSRIWAPNISAKQEDLYKLDHIYATWLPVPKWTGGTGSCRRGIETRSLAGF